jgi:hypothetical protein
MSHFRPPRWNDGNGQNEGSFPVVEPRDGSDMSSKIGLDSNVQPAWPAALQELALITGVFVDMRNERRQK